MMKQTTLIVAWLILLAACGLNGASPLSDNPTPQTAPATTRAAPATTRAADPHYVEKCKVLDRNIMNGERWDVSCVVEFDWPTAEENVYFEVRFFDGDDFQVDFINEIVNLKAGRNKVHLTGWTKSGWTSYAVFTR